jgi:hypothetical protein
MRRSAGGVVVAVACAALLVTGLVASARTPARHTGQEDANDTNGPLDVRQVEQVHWTPNGPVWTLITFSSWTVDRIWDRGYLIVYLDTIWDGRADYFAMIRSTGDRLVGSLFRDRPDGRDVFLRTLTVWRGDGFRASVKVPFTALKVDPTRWSYRWYAVTLLTSEICPATCIDRVPDAGVVEQLIPGATSPPPTTTTPPSTDPPPSTDAG